MITSILIPLLAFVTPAFSTQNGIKQEIIRSYHVQNTNGTISPNINKPLEWQNFQPYPYLLDYVSLSQEKYYNSKGQILSERYLESKYTYVYDENESLYMQITEQLGSPFRKDTTVYQYNDKGDISFTYELPAMEKSTYYFDENDRVIPYVKYDYKNKKHSRREIEQIVSTTYEYSQETNKIRKKEKGRFELIDRKRIGQKLEALGEESFTYYPNGNLKLKSYVDQFFSIKEESNEEGSQQIVHSAAQGMPLTVDVYYLEQGKKKKIESSTYPYNNPPNGIKSESSVIEIEYDENKLVSKVTYTDLLLLKNSISIFKYKLNSKNEWIEKIIYVDGVAKFIVKRDLIYF